MKPFYFTEVSYVKTEKYIFKIKTGEMNFKCELKNEYEQKESISTLEKN